MQRGVYSTVTCSRLVARLLGQKVPTSTEEHSGDIPAGLALVWWRQMSLPREVLDVRNDLDYGRDRCWLYVVFRGYQRQNDVGLKVYHV